MTHSLIAVLMLCSLRCAALAQGETPVAAVNGVAISSETYEREFSTSLEYWKKKYPDLSPADVEKLRASTLEELINRELLVQEANRLKIEVLPGEVDSAVAEIRSHFLTDDSGKKLSDAEAEGAFQTELKKAGKTFEQFRKGLAPQILMRKLLAQQKASPSKNGEDAVKAYVDSLRPNASIVRGPAAADAVKARKAAEKPARPWWDQ